MDSQVSTLSGREVKLVESCSGSECENDSGVSVDGGQELMSRIIKTRNEVVDRVVSEANAKLPLTPSEVREIVERSSRPIYDQGGIGASWAYACAAPIRMQYATAHEALHGEKSQAIPPKPKRIKEVPVSRLTLKQRKRILARKVGR